jgi:hypothetical protein
VLAAISLRGAPGSVEGVAVVLLTARTTLTMRTTLPVRSREQHV